jgi:hypothetical protein
MAETSMDLIARSLDAVVERAGDPTAQIYARLFAEFPETEARFIRDVSGAIRAEMLTMVFDCLMHPGGGYQNNLIRAERVNHDGFGTEPAVFDRFFFIVRDVCRELAGPGWTPVFDIAWSTRIDEVTTAIA